MGNWFSNLHIRKDDVFTQDTVEEAIKGIMDAQGYQSAVSEEEAEGVIAILSDEHSGWFSIYSEMLAFEEPEQFAEIAAPLSRELQTDILGISCFDSDYLYLNLINPGSKTNAWVGIGSPSAYDIRRRTNLSAWKAKVDNFPHFTESAKKRYVFAEEFLAESEHCLTLPQIYSAANWEDLPELGLSEQAKYLYFKPADNTSSKEGTQTQYEKPRLHLEPEGDYNEPCTTEKKCTLYLRNYGGGSKGLSIYFTGPYVKDDELTFSDTTLWRWKGDDLESHPFELQKIRISNRKWAYYYHDPDFEILPRLTRTDIDKRLPLKKQLQIDRDQSIIFTFIPHGNDRKALDVTIVFEPDENPEGQVSWNVWKGHFKSKKAYFDFYDLIPNIPGMNFWKPKREDYD